MRDGAEPSNMNPGKMEMEMGNEAARGSLGGGFRGGGGGVGALRGCGN